MISSFSCKSAFQYSDKRAIIGKLSGLSTLYKFGLRPTKLGFVTVVLNIDLFVSLLQNGQQFEFSAPFLKLVQNKL
jgi:hypothetical protein